MLDIINKITPEIKADMETIWFTADLHFSHDKIVSICNRPCSIDNHNEWIVEQVNSVVKKKHRLYILGDVSMINKVNTELLLDKLNGTKYLIIGNHDKNVNKSTRFEQISQIKDFTYSKGDLNIHIVLCHYPIISWNRKVHGSWHLYGHVHGRFAMRNLSMDVGIDNDNHRYPYNLYEICQIMEEKSKLYSDYKIDN